VCLGHLYAGVICEVPQAAGRCVTVHPGAAAVEQDRPVRADSSSPVDGPPYHRRQRDQDNLVPLPHTRSTRWPCSSPRSPMSAPVASKIRKPSSPSMATSAKS
jgi:hypothetical protein